VACGGGATVDVPVAIIRGETTSWTFPLIGDVFVVRRDGSGGAVDGY
jgi:hypothetical protein